MPNCLAQPYSSNHDYSTTGFSGAFWLKEAPNTAIEYILNRDSPTPAQAIRLWVSAAGFLVFELYDGTTTRTATGTVAVDDSTWKFVSFDYSAGTLNVYVNAVLYATATGAALSTLNNSTAVLQLGLNVAGASPLTNGLLALFRMSATIPLLDQLAEIYRDELPLIQGKPCTLTNSSAITALNRDKQTDTYYAGTASEYAGFHNLQRTSWTAVGSSVPSIAAANGAVFVAGVNTYYQPAIRLRDELARQAEAKAAYGSAPEMFRAVVSGTTYTLQKGWRVKAVYVNGTLQWDDLGATQYDFYVVNDGYADTVTFRTTLASAKVTVMAIPV